MKKLKFVRKTNRNNSFSHFSIEGTDTYFCLEGMAKVLHIPKNTRSFTIQVSKRKFKEYIPIDIYKGHFAMWINDECLNDGSTDYVMAHYPDSTNLWVKVVNIR